METVIGKKKEQLAELMSEISEWCWSATWIMGNEYALWDFINSEGSKKYGVCETETDHVFAEDLQKLKALAEEVGQWPVWDDEVTDAETVAGMYLRWVSIEEWKQIVVDARSGGGAA